MKFGETQMRKLFEVHHLVDLSQRPRRMERKTPGGSRVCSRQRRRSQVTKAHLEIFCWRGRTTGPPSPLAPPSPPFSIFHTQPIGRRRLTESRLGTFMRDAFQKLITGLILLGLSILKVTLLCMLIR